MSLIMPPGVRIKIDGEGEDERFTVIIFPEEQKAPGHFMNTIGPMTEAEFRADLRSRGTPDLLIEQTITEARQHTAARRGSKSS